MALNADRPWVRQYVRKAIQNMEDDILGSVQEALEEFAREYHQAIEEIWEELDDADEDLDSEDELPPGTAIYFANGPQNVLTYPTTRSLDSFTFSDRPRWTYEGSPSPWPIVDGVEGNAWVIANINDTWWAATYEWLRPYQTEKIEVTRENIGAHTKAQPFVNWVPRPGDELFFFNSTHARGGLRSPSPQRSNVVRVVLT